MILRFFSLIALLLPLIEIAGMVLVGQEIGVLGVLGLLLLDVVIGVSLLRRQGLETVRHMRRAFDGGEMPVAEMRDGFLLAMAGILFLLPGFVSDIAAIVLLVPALRRRIARRTESFVHVSGMRQGRGGGPIIDAEEWVVEEDGAVYPSRSETTPRISPHKENIPPRERH